ncbi:MAG: beta-N-acetylhexosaminidase, partial [Ginsengibacter sp.]
MRKGFFISFLFFISVSVIGQKNDVAQLLIPEPVSVTSGTGNFVFTSKTPVHVLSTDASAKRVGEFLSKKIGKVTGYSVPVMVGSKNSEINNGIKLSIIKDESLGDEGYQLKVSAHEISISANKPAGLFYGMQSLFQLMPKEVEADTLVRNVEWNVPVCSIKDYPRFGWRGLMFDVSRHFFGKKDVE